MPYKEIQNLVLDFNKLLEKLAKEEQRDRALALDLSREVSRRRSLFNANRDGLAILDGNGDVLEVNPMCAQMLGYARGELKGGNVSLWDAGFKTSMEKVQSHSVGLIYETIHRRKNGTEYHAEVALSPARWEGSNYLILSQRDISSKVDVENELRNHRDHLENLVLNRTQALEQVSTRLNDVFELSPDGFVVFDERWRVIFVNPAFSRIFGLRPDQIVGLQKNDFSRTIEDLCEKGGNDRGVDALLDLPEPIQSTDSPPLTDGGGRKVLASNRQVVELRNHPKRVIELRARVAASRTHAAVIYARDITHAVEINRMKSEFLSTAAHELRTPMTSIIGFSELLIRRNFDESTTKELLQKIFGKSQQMVAIINELLDLARIEARRGKDFKMEELTLNELIDDALDGWHVPEGRREPIVRLESKLPRIRGDRAKLSQVLKNLLSNAYKYSPNGGDILITAMTSSESGAVQAGFSVEDHGIGMSDEQKGQVFDRFWRADLSGNIPGTGLGLSIVKEIIDLHDGTIHVKSLPGKGSTFTVLLPPV